MVPPTVPGSRGGQQEDLFIDAARELAQQHEHISTSFLQRKLHIGYPRAARIMEQIEEEMGGEVEVGEEDMGTA